MGACQGDCRRDKKAIGPRRSQLEQKHLRGASQPSWDGSGVPQQNQGPVSGMLMHSAAAHTAQHTDTRSVHLYTPCPPVHKPTPCVCVHSFVSSFFHCNGTCNHVAEVTTPAHHGNCLHTCYVLRVGKVRITAYVIMGG